MEELNNAHRLKKNWICEGHIGRNQNQIKKLTELCKTHDFKNILEIGFNAGHSSMLMLENTTANIISIDICSHEYTYDGKDVVDELFPDRHILFRGNSMELLKTDIIPNIDYDLIYIDGGHSYKCCTSDILNCKKYASKNTIIIVDDIVYDPEHIKPWNKQVTKVWNEMKNNGFIIETEYCYFGKGQGFALGRYNL